MKDSPVVTMNRLSLLGGLASLRETILVQDSLISREIRTSPQNGARWCIAPTENPWFSRAVCTQIHPRGEKRKKHYHCGKKDKKDKQFNRLLTF
jgi:hypothetical protein